MESFSFVQEIMKYFRLFRVPAEGYEGGGLVFETQVQQVGSLFTQILNHEVRMKKKTTHQDPDRLGSVLKWPEVGKFYFWSIYSEKFIDFSLILNVIRALK